MAKKKRQFDNEFPSVTQVLDMLRKPGLENWFKYTPIKEIKEQSEKGKLIGTQIHEAIHLYIETGTTKVETKYAEEVTYALKSFLKFRKEHPEIALKNAEIQLTSHTHQFNGTLDCLSDNLIVDWKTAAAKDKEAPDIYDEYIYQVSAYVSLYNEVNKTNIERAVIVSLAKDKEAYALRELNKEEITGAFNEVFLPVLRIWNYKNRRKA